MLCIDHPVVQGMIPRLSERRIVTYGFSPQADIRALNVRLRPEGSHFDAVVADRVSGQERRLADLFLPMFGEHNVQNALTVLAIAEELGLGDGVVRDSLRNFAGVRRRFTKTGEWNGVAIIDDYGHHPVEIAAVLKGRGRSRGPRHRRRAAAPLHPPGASVRRVLHLLQRCRPRAGRRCLPGRRGADRGCLARRAGRRPQAHGHRSAMALPGPQELAPTLWQLARPGDIVVCLGAGSITNWANALPAELAALDSRSRVA